MKLTTAGESHGKGLFAILEGLPAGLTLDGGEIDAYLALRQSGYGRGARQKIEHDRAEILSGVRNMVTLGSPVTVAVWNRDYANWKEYMAPEGCDGTARRLTKVRPGHADLSGLKKYGTEGRAQRSRARLCAGDGRPCCGRDDLPSAPARTRGGNFGICAPRGGGLRRDGISL